METRTYAGIMVGTMTGLVIVWGATVSALSEGGLAFLAATVDGIMAGIGIGGLIGLNIALGAVLEEKKADRTVLPGLPKAA